MICDCLPCIRHLIIQRDPSGQTSQTNCDLFLMMCDIFIFSPLSEERRGEKIKMSHIIRKRSQPVTLVIMQPTETRQRCNERAMSESLYIVVLFQPGFNQFLFLLIYDSCKYDDEKVLKPRNNGSNKGTNGALKTLKSFTSNV